MPQTKKGSLLEACTNMAIGIAVSVVSNVVVLPLVGLPHPDAFQLSSICFYFTLISVARSYCVRRLYNHFGWFQKRDAEKDRVMQLYATLLLDHAKLKAHCGAQRSAFLDLYLEGVWALANKPYSPEQEKLWREAATVFELPVGTATENGVAP